MPLMHSMKQKLVYTVISNMGFEKKIPKTIEGAGCIAQIGKVAKEFGMTRPLVVTDPMLVELGLVDRCLEGLRSENMEFGLYDQVTPDPTIKQVETGMKLYKQGKCDGLIAFGGGSSMDCAKTIGAAITNNKTASELRNPGSVKKPLPPLICVPTTAGTGSEVTLGAVLRDDEQEVKFTVVSLELVPLAAILDPELLQGLPKPITAATGMDAMTHAVEAYTGTWSRPDSMKWSELAIVKLCKYLERSYDDGNDMEARAQVLKAAFEAGVAISMAGVGYVHAIAHTVGARFHTPHGVANAMIMPKVLDFYVSGDGCSAVERLASLAVLVGLGTRDSDSEVNLANKFIAKLRDMNAHMNLPQAVQGMKVNDVSGVASRALSEAHGQLYNPLWNPLLWLQDGGYPAPKILDQKDCEKIVHSLLEDNSVRASM